MQPTSARVVARIGRPHGLRGEVTVRLHTDDPETRFLPGTTFATEPGPGAGVRQLTVRSARVHNGTWLLAFEQVEDRSGAESLRGTRLLLDLATTERAEQPEEPESWYEEDLVGLVAVTADGAQVGLVRALEVGAAQDLLVLTLTGGGTAYIPFVSALVPEVDTRAGKVVIAPPPGLLELNS